MPPVLEVIVACITIHVNLGVFTAVAFVIRWYWDQRRWTRFRRSLHRLGYLEDLMPDDLKKRDWKALTAMTLSEAGFAPAECVTFLDLGIHIALGEASVTFRRFKGSHTAAAQMET